LFKVSEAISMCSDAHSITLIKK